MHIATLHAVVTRDKFERQLVPARVSIDTSLVQLQAKSAPSPQAIYRLAKGGKQRAQPFHTDADSIACC